MKTLQDCKDKAAQNHEFSSWDSLCKMLKHNGVYEANIGVFHDEAAELYARSVWDEACELTGNRIWNALKHKTHPDPVNGDSVQVQHIARAVSGDKPEFKP